MQWRRQSRLTQSDGKSGKEVWLNRNATVHEYVKPVYNNLPGFVKASSKEMAKENIDGR